MPGVGFAGCSPIQSGELDAHLLTDVLPVLAGGSELRRLRLSKQYDCATAMAAMKVSTNANTTAPGDTSRTVS